MLKNRFRCACETAGVPTTVNMIRDVSTRWNSTYDMIGIALKLRKGLDVICDINGELKIFKISDKEWSILESVHKFLINFKILSTKLGGEKYVTLPMVILSFNLLLDKIEASIKGLDDKDQRSEVDEMLLLAFQAARDKILKYYQKTSWINCVVLILDPRHKVKTFEMTSWGKEMKDNSF